LQVVRREIPQDAVVGRDDCLGQAALVILQLQDFFLDGIAGDETVGEDVPILPDAVRAIDGLCFDRRIPPGIEDENVVPPSD